MRSKHKMSKTVTQLLASMRLTEATIDGKSGLGIDWDQGSDASQVTGGLFHTYVHALALVSGAYGNYADLATSGRVSKIGERVLLAAEFCGLDADVVCDTTKLSFGTDRCGYMFDFVSNANDDRVNALRQKYTSTFIDTIRKLVGISPTLNLASAAGSIIRANYPAGQPPNLTCSAEFAALLLYIAQSRKEMISRQEILSYAREVLASIEKLMLDEDEVGSGTLFTITQLIGPEKTKRFCDMFKREGMHFSHYGRDAKLERPDCTRFLLQKVFGESNNCSICMHNLSKISDQLPASVERPLRYSISPVLNFHVDSRGILHRTPERYSSVQLYLTAVKNRPSVYDYLLERNPVLADEISRSIRDQQFEETPRGFVTESAAESWAASHRELARRIPTESISSRQALETIALDPRDKLRHILNFHSDDVFLPSEALNLESLFVQLDLDEHQKRSIRDLLRPLEAYVEPLDLYTVLYPQYWGNPGKELIAVRKVRRMARVSSLDGSRAILQCAIDAFYEATRFDGMEAFVRNTSILSGKTSFAEVLPPRPVRPHSFQREYAMQILNRVKADMELSRGASATGASTTDEVIEDMSISIDLQTMARELNLVGFMQGIWKYSADNDDDLGSAGIFADYVGWLCSLPALSSIDASGALFRHARSLSQRYKRASASTNASVRRGVAAIGLLLLRSEAVPMADSYYQQVVDEATRKIALINEVYNFQPSDMLSPFSDLGSPTFANSAAPHDNPAIQMVLNDYGRLRQLAAPATRIAIERNSGNVDFTFNDNIAGAGKTSMAIIGAALMHTLKRTYVDQIPYHLELVLVCDQQLVREQTFNTIKNELTGVVNVTSIESSRPPRSNFTLEGHREPGFKCGRERDLVIMSSEFVVPYILGRKDAGTVTSYREGDWLGNPRAYVFIDEFGAKLGNIEAIAALSEASNIDGLLKAIAKYAPAMLVMTNAPGMLTITGATVVPQVLIMRTIESHSPGRRISHPPRPAAGEIYVGSQFYSADGNLRHLWNLCPSELLGDLFIGMRRPLIRRTIGHRAATDLRAQLSAAMERYPQLREMTEYLQYDLGIYTGDTVADYVMGLLYFTYLYALRYLEPAPDLQLRCSDMAKSLEVNMNARLPPDAPWPRSHFALPDVAYRSKPAPGGGIEGPNFFRTIGVHSEWQGRVPRQGRDITRAQNLATMSFPDTMSPRVNGALERAIRAVDPTNPPRWALPKISMARKREFEPDPWTTFGRAVAYLRSAGRNLEHTQVCFVLDSKPYEFAMRVVAAAEGISVEKMQERGQEQILRAQDKENQRRRIAQANEKKAIAAARASGSHRVINEKGVYESSRPDPTSFDGNEGLNADVLHPITKNRFIVSDPNASKTETKIDLRSDIDAYLLSWGVVYISSSMSEEDVSKIGSFINDPPSGVRILMVVVDSIGAYGLNVKNTTVAIPTPRAAKAVSHQTLLQFFCRAGRRGLSDDASLYLDDVTMVRILDASIHDMDAALFPNIASSIEDLRQNAIQFDAWVREVSQACNEAHDAAVRDLENAIRRVAETRSDGALMNRWTWEAIMFENSDRAAYDHLHSLEERVTTEPDAMARRAVCAMLTERLLRKGQHVRDCTLLSFYIGAVQSHLHEPFGIVEPRSQRVPVYAAAAAAAAASEFYEEEVLPAATWPRMGGDRREIELLLEIAHKTALAFAQARDLSSYELYGRFIALRFENSATVANKLISTIAFDAMSKLPQQAVKSTNYYRNVQE